MYSFNLKSLNDKVAELKDQLTLARLDKLKATLKEDMLYNVIEYNSDSFEYDSDSFEYDPAHSSNSNKETTFSLCEIGTVFETLADELDDGFEVIVETEKELGGVVRHVLTIHIK